MLKKYVLPLALFFTSITLGYAIDSPFTNNSRKRIETDIQYFSTPVIIERSSCVTMLDIYFNSNTGQVECDLWNIGKAYVFVCDLNGTIVDSLQADTDLPTTVFLNADSCNRGFYVLIYSDRLCAEGCHLF